MSALTVEELKYSEDSEKFSEIPWGEDNDKDDEKDSLEKKYEPAFTPSPEREPSPVFERGSDQDSADDLKLSKEKMKSIFGSKLIDCDTGKKVSGKLEGYKLVMIFHTASHETYWEPWS